jgi:hypothetical protein
LGDEALANVFQNPESMNKAWHGQCHSKFAHWPQLAIAAALDDLEAVEFEPRNTVDDRHVLEPVAKIRGHLATPSANRRDTGTN